MQRQEKSNGFKCRICDCVEYYEMRENNGILGPAGRTWVAYCICKGCSVLFFDPKKFSQK